MKTPWTFHGGRLAEAQARYGGGPWLDLSTGINPNPWAGVDTLAIDWQRLPDETALRELERTAAGRFGVDPVHICALPGTEIGLRLLPDIVEAPSAYVAPAYRTHMDLAGKGIGLGASVLPSPSGSLILANPNNPDGRVLSADLLSRQLASGDWLTIDEAFADAMPDVSLADQIGDDRRLIIFRSFGKFFGLAGVRLGFVLGPRDVIEHYRATLGSWPLSAAAIAIGTAAYRDRRWSDAMRVSLPLQAAALDAVLARHDLAAIGDCPLFRLIETPDASALFERLARQAILTRPFEDNRRWLRIGLPGSAEALARLDRALAYV